MSLITRCPACGTMFKVVPDQLRISEGWVRCGHCADVFDASAHLQADAPVVPEAPPVESPATLVRESGGVAAPADTPDIDEGQAEPEEFLSSLNTEVDGAMALDAPDSAQLEAEARTLRETPLDRPFELRRQDEADEVAEPLPSRFTPVPESELEPELHDLSFVRQARSQEFWRKPGIRAVLALVLLVLVFLLAAQIGVHDRDRLAAAHPALRPWLARLCEPLRCRIAPPRQIDAIVIDSSSFNKLRGDAYRLNFTLKNQATMQVAMPALELTLTDGQEQPVVRRVLLPADLGTHPGVIAATADWSGSLALAVAGNGAGARIAGYRLLAFYP
ncbi:MAG: DUF3426 domain-containing protein [Ramlibacter sp.]|nr:DUF3426 domain-containing protein [Ramlibacter sp.]